MFELQVVSNTPLTPLNDIDDVTLQFLQMIGYLPKGYDPKTKADNVQESVPYRLFTECLVGNMKRAWTVEDLAAKLRTTKPTIYRHLNKLKAIDILEEVDTLQGGERKKGYRVRYGDLSKAWNFTEANVQMAMDSYRKTIDHLQGLVERER